MVEPASLGENPRKHIPLLILLSNVKSIAFENTGNPGDMAAEFRGNVVVYAGDGVVELDFAG